MGLDAKYLDAKYATPCATFFTCGATYDSKAGTDAAANPSVEAARAALKATKYAGEPIIVMQASDLEAPRIPAQILAEKLKQAGFNVDLQVMDWASVLARRTKKEGWSLYGVHAGGFDLGSPLTNVMGRSTASTSRAGNATRASRRCWMPLPRHPLRRIARKSRRRSRP